MLLYKQSTAATLIVGPILDSTGAEYASAVIGDLSISKNGGTLTALAAAATLTHIANGQYTLVLTTGNTDTIGRAQITCNKSTYQMPMAELMVLQGTTFDALVTNAAGDANGMLYNGSNTGAVIPTVTTLTNLPAITSNWLTAAGLAADAVTEIQSGLATSSALATAQTSIDNIPTNAELATALAAADDAVLAAIAALNNLSSAGAASAVTTALTTALTEGYRGTGATGSVRDLLYEVIAHLGEMSISSTTKTLKKLDGSTTAKTYTLDSATTPTSITETT